MQGKRLIVLVVFVMILGYLLLVYTDWPVLIPFLRQTTLQWCEPTPGLFYISHNISGSGMGALWRMDSNGLPEPIAVRQDLDYESAIGSPDGRYLAFKVKESGSNRHRLYLGCANGSRIFAVTGWSKELGFRWLNSEILNYNIGTYQDYGDPANTDLQEYLLNIKTGELGIEGNPSVYLEYNRNPSNTDLVSALRWGGGDYWLINTRTGARIKIEGISTEGGILGSWSPDGKRLALKTGFASSGPEIFIVNSDGSNLMQLTDIHSSMPAVYPVEFTWSPDNQWLALLLHHKSDPSQRDLYILSPSDRKLIDMEVKWDTFDWPVWSPDSRQIAFVSRQIGSGQMDIFTISIVTKRIQQLTNDATYKSSLGWQ